MISIEKQAKELVMDMAREHGAGTIIRFIEGKFRVEVANGARGYVWNFERMANNPGRAIREIEADMRHALRQVGLWNDAAPAPVAPVFVAQVKRTPRGLDGPIGNRIREEVVRRIEKPAETDQPDAAFAHVTIPERKEKKETRLLRERVAQLERDMANVKQITDQLR